MPHTIKCIMCTYSHGLLKNTINVYSHAPPQSQEVSCLHHLHTPQVLMMLEQWNEWRSNNEINKDETIKWMMFNFQNKGEGKGLIDMDKCVGR
jgi:hypothetical protein